MDGQQKDRDDHDQRFFIRNERSSSSADFQKTVETLKLNTDSAQLPGRITLRPGSVFGGRYEILRQVGEGGMGTVFKAKDRELDRVVALKVIRPEMANQPEVVQRFKQELILARQITHKNVIRIFELGEADGIKFIGMEYVEGQDLGSLLSQRGKLPSEEAASIIVQVCRALVAAHAEGVVHRDLKPQNIMIDAQAKATVMDFGIAQSTESAGMTQTGALLGTPHYMSPEQAMGQKADARSDLFAVGIIFYELLTGDTPFKGDSAVASLLKRTQQRARPPIELEGSIPRYLSDMVMKCLELNPRYRYQEASEIVAALEARCRTRTNGFALRIPRIVKELPTRWVATTLAVALLVVGIAFRGRLVRPEPQPTSQPAILLAIIPFRNASGDASLNWLGTYLAETLDTGMGQSSLMHTVPSNRITQIVHDLRLTPDASIDPGMLREIGEASGADRLISGQFARFTEEIQIDATLRDLKQQRTVEFKTSAVNEKDLTHVMENLAAEIQHKMALPREVVKELHASTLKPSTQSVQALRYYLEGQELVRQGEDKEATERFRSSINYDSNFALAYAELGQSYANLGRGTPAEQASRRAVNLSENLPPLEKQLIAALHAETIHDNSKAIEEYVRLANVFPEDPDVQFALAGLYKTAGSFDRARQFYKKLLSRDPKNVRGLYGLAGVEIDAGDSQKALEYLSGALPITIQLGNDLEKAMILYGLGVAYAQLNKQEDARHNYEQALEIQRQLGDEHGMAQTLNGMAQGQDALGESAAALKSFQASLQLRRELGDKAGEGDTLIDLANYYESRGQNDQALSMLQDSLRIQQELGNHTYEALCVNNIAANYSDKGQYSEALIYLDKALMLREKINDPTSIADSNYLMADTLVKVGQYDSALPHYVRALDLWRTVNDKRRIAYATYGLAILFEQQGRLGAGLNAKEDSLKTMRELQDRVGIADILGGYAASLDLVGRGGEASKHLQEALVLSRELSNQIFISQNLNFQGDGFFHRREFEHAKTIYHQAFQVASKTTDKRLILTSKFNLAKVMVKQGRLQGGINTLEDLAEQADRLGLKNLSIECSTYTAEALIQRRDYAHARERLELDLGNSEKFGLRMETARIHYLLGTVLRLIGDASDAAPQYSMALRLLRDIQKEPGAEHIFDRPDLHDIYSESVRWTSEKDPS